MIHSASHPPPLTIQPVLKMKLRFVSTGAVAAQSFTYANLSSMLGIIAETTTAANFLSLAFKFRGMRVWGPVATAGTPVTVSCTMTQPSADFVTPPKTWTDTSISYDHPAFLNIRPPPGSLASKWHSSAQTDEIFSLSFPTGSTVDIDFSYVLCDLGFLTGIVIAGGTVGEIYHKTVNNLVVTGGLNAI